MKRVITKERPNWKSEAEEMGFKLHTMYGEPYWNEGVYYGFTLDQIENDIEDVSQELHEMCMDIVPDILNSDQLMTQLQIPEQHWDLVKESWRTEKNNDIYGRFDLLYDGEGPAKMLEYNADTPTSLYEAAAFQWKWLEDCLKLGYVDIMSDQFNSIQEQLIAAFSKIDKSHDFFFSSFKDVEEDYMTVEYMAWMAKDAGLVPQYISIQDISVLTNDQFSTPDGMPIRNIFMLYPIEDMLLDDFSKYINTTSTKFFEPIWKTVLSNKGILPILWNKHKNHPNLLPSYFGNEYDGSLSATVTKPVYSREGASVNINDNGVITNSRNDGYSNNNSIIQQYHKIKTFDGMNPVIGSWIVNGTACGIGIREDKEKITQDLSRFTPHVIME